MLKKLKAQPGRTITIKTVHVIYYDLECNSHMITKLCNPQIMFLETQQKDIIYKKGKYILQEARWREVQFKRQIQR